MSTEDITAGPAVDAGSPADVRIAAIRELVEQAQRRQNDVDELLDLHTDDAAIVNVAGRYVPDKAAFRDAMQRALRSPLADVVTTSEIDDIRFVRPDVAIISCIKHIDDRGTSGHDPEASSLPNSGRLTYVVVDDGNRWRINHAQTTAIQSA